MKPRLDISLFALRRSGIHGFLCWLGYHFTHPVNLITDVKLYGKESPTSILDRHQTNPVYHESWVDNSRVSPSAFIHTYEHYSFWKKRDLDRIANYSHHGDHRVHIVLIRDHLNNYASQLKIGDKGNHGWPNPAFKKYWTEHATEFLSRGERIGGCVPILYNRWFTSFDYRRLIEKTLELPESDEGLQHVPNVTGIGSSFDGVEYDGRAEEMPVTTRWLEYKDDERFLEVYRDEAMLRLASDVAIGAERLLKRC